MRAGSRLERSIAGEWVFSVPQLEPISYGRLVSVLQVCSEAIRLLQLGENCKPKIHISHKPCQVTCKRLFTPCINMHLQRLLL